MNGTGLGHVATQNIVKDTLAQGGGTYGMLTGERINFDHGFMVSVDEGRGKVVPVEEFTATTVGVFSLQNFDYMLANGAKFIGTWVSDGQVHIDVATLFEEVGGALMSALEHDQEAIWSNELGCEIPALDGFITWLGKVLS